MRTRKEGRNGWIITDSGKVIANFFAGDAIEDVFTTKNFLVVTYFDESALGNGIETNGIVAFDLQGTYQFGYRELFSTDAVDIADCYSACWVAGDRILFFPYTRFPLVTLDLHEQKQQVLETPAEVAGANAITSVGPNVYFHGPYDDPPGIYKWRIADTNAERIGEFPGHLRGLCKGRFLSVERNGYTILSIKE